MKTRRPAPAAPQEPPPEVADAWIAGRAPGAPRVSAEHPADTREVSPRHPADTPQVSRPRDEAFWRGALAGDVAAAGHPAGVSETPGEHPGGVSQVSAGHPKPRAPAGTAVMFARKRGRPKRRMNVYFNEDTFQLLEEHCASENEELSRVIDRAVREYLRARVALR